MNDFFMISGSANSWLLGKLNVSNFAVQLQMLAPQILRSGRVAARLVNVAASVRHEVALRVLSAIFGTQHRTQYRRMELL
jgi:hypothetical protein